MATDIAAPYYELRTEPAPPVATDFTITAPGDRAWRVLALTFRFVTDANVASRALRLQADDGGNPFFVVGPETDQAASITRQISVVNGAPAFGGLSGLQMLPWPDTGLFLRPGWRLRTAISNLQVGDQIDQISYAVLSYPNTDGKGWLPSPPYASSY